MMTMLLSPAARSSRARVSLGALMLGFSLLPALTAGCNATEDEPAGPRARQGAASGSAPQTAAAPSETGDGEKIADLSKGLPADDETVIDPFTGEKIPPLTAEELRLMATPAAELSKEDRVKRSRALRKKVLRNPNSESAKSLRDASNQLKSQIEAQGSEGGGQAETTPVLKPSTP